MQAEDRVTVIEIPGDGWMKIRSENGEGYIPESYAQIEQWMLQSGIHVEFVSATVWYIDIVAGHCEFMKDGMFSLD